MFFFITTVTIYSRFIIRFVAILFNPPTLIEMKYIGERASISCFTNFGFIPSPLPINSNNIRSGSKVISHFL